MSVKVGLVTSSGSAASRAWAMPFTRVVLPVPNSPRNSRSCGGFKRLASLRPTSIVSAPLRVVNWCVRPSATGASLLILLPRGSPSRYPLQSPHERRPVHEGSSPRQPLQPNITVPGAGVKAKSPRKMRKTVRSEQGVLVLFADREVGSEPVEKDRRFDGALGIVLILREDPGHHAGEQVAAAAFCHARITGGVHGHAAAGMGNQGACTF